MYPQHLKQTICKSFALELKRSDVVEKKMFYATELFLFLFLGSKTRPCYYICTQDCEISKESGPCKECEMGS